MRNTGLESLLLSRYVANEVLLPTHHLALNPRKDHLQSVTLHDLFDLILYREDPDNARK